MTPALDVMRQTAALFILAGALVLGGCATAPVVQAPRTTVVLLPDEDGNVGAVLVTTDAGSQRIDKAYHASTVIGAHARPSDATPLGAEAVGAGYEKLLNAQPLKPKSFVVRFLLDTTTLTDESRAMMPAVFAAIRERKPTEITIFGHADATGSETHNARLSADRARVVAALLRKTDPTLDHIEVHWFGDRAPLYPSDARTPDPRNRRAEIVVL